MFAARRSSRWAQGGKPDVYTLGFQLGPFVVRAVHLRLQIPSEDGLPPTSRTKGLCTEEFRAAAAAEVARVTCLLALTAPSQISGGIVLRITVKTLVPPSQQRGSPSFLRWAALWPRRHRPGHDGELDGGIVVDGTWWEAVTRSSRQLCGVVAADGAPKVFSNAVRETC